MPHWCSHHTAGGTIYSQAKMPFQWYLIHLNIMLTDLTALNWSVNKEQIINSASFSFTLQQVLIETLSNPKSPQQWQQGCAKKGHKHIQPFSIHFLINIFPCVAWLLKVSNKLLCCGIWWVFSGNIAVCTEWSTFSLLKTSAKKYTKHGDLWTTWEVWFPAVTWWCLIRWILK